MMQIFSIPANHLYMPVQSHCFATKITGNACSDQADVTIHRPAFSRTTVAIIVNAIRNRQVLGLVVSLICLSGLHAGTTSDGFVYSDNGTNITITGYTGSGGDITLPGTINSEPVVSIASNAFNNCTNLAGVTIPTSVTSIGDNAFNGCTDLASVTIPASVGSIGVGPFQNCTQLAQVNVDPANPAYASSGGVLFNASLTQLIQYPDGNTQTSYTIPASVTSIGDFAFFGGRNLASVTIPGSVTAIGNNAFSSSSLTSVTIPASVASIGNDPFVGCTGLTQINVDPANSSYASPGGVLFNKSLTQLVQYPVASTQTSYVIPASVTMIADNAFAAAGLTSITIPAGVTSIGTDAFAGCLLLTQINVDPANSTYASPGGVLLDKPLTQIIQYPAANTQTSYVIPSSVVSIGEGAFFDCASLATVTIPASFTSIGKNAFGMSGVNSVAIPAGVTSIGNYAFANCIQLTQINVDAANSVYASINGILFNKSLTQLITYPAGDTQPSCTIPSSVTSIGIDAFYGCTGLFDVTIPTSVASIGDGAFANCNGLHSISIPASVTSIGSDVFTDCLELSQISVDAANPSYSSVGGVLFDKSLTQLIQYPASNTQTSYVIPSSVVSVGFGAFLGSTNLTTITVPASVASIGDNAFSGCKKLTQITADPASPLFANQNGVLFNKSLTQLIAYPAANTQASYTIPSSVTSIKSDAFSDCANLTTITIPASVTSIGDEAFDSCSGLTAAYFLGNAPTFFGMGVFDGTAASFTILFPTSATGFTTPSWHGYHAVPNVPTQQPSPSRSPSASGGGGALSLWCYGALSLLAAARRFLPRRIKEN